MSEESYGFTQAKVRLEEIVVQVRKKDTSLEKSLDLLEEGVRLANRCTELIDQADWDAALETVGEDSEDTAPVDASASDPDAVDDDSLAGDPGNAQVTESVDQSR
jgi:exodeoxyribonuclease VII small subunit